MHERERHRLILNAVQSRAVATVGELVALTASSEATVRRDIAALDSAGRLRRVRGGAEALEPSGPGTLLGRSFRANETLHIEKKRAIARAASALCADGEPIIINGGTTTFQMVHALGDRRLQVFTNSFPIAEHLLHHSRNGVMIQGGTIYREQSIILSPFENDVSRHFYARKMFMSSQGIGPQGLMEADPLLIQAELKLIDQADELIVLADSSKFSGRSSFILCPLERVTTVITDPGITAENRQMLADAGVGLIVVGEAEASAA
ncbi:DeoR/GlpR transcriptional regulator [Arsenicitalea aurantiaca]|uniref:DeoR/GlpR transcriptional regulator n=1 Tax=Arsenicitalea aurantiaca TaxID=1783274 RepID=A0A433X8D0_9HYPH|nr:DeoR/GlpR family DNA-binding transcription regulator [Arsenicitalea aurantiaca]RUT30326.1 DeoR/GlpR transcriptional regulator [Arsenicitalea aurantiaca]